MKKIQFLDSRRREIRKKKLLVANKFDVGTKSYMY